MIPDYGRLAREQQEAAVAADAALAQEIRRRTRVTSQYGESMASGAVRRLRSIEDEIVEMRMREIQQRMERERIKPRLRRGEHQLGPKLWLWVWYCEGGGLQAYGLTPRMAYDEWRKHL